MQRKGASSGLPSSALSHHKIFLSCCTDGVQNCNGRMRMFRQLQKSDAVCLPPKLCVYGLCRSRLGVCFVFPRCGSCLALVDTVTNMS